MTRYARKAGFTLVEILIVVVILGILAAIVIPQFSSASESARASSLLTQLQTIRSQLELYQVQHLGDYPNLSANWDQMITVTASDGLAPENGETELGPYMQKAPVNPFESSSTTAAAAAAEVGWTYNQTTGVITAVMSLDKATALDLQDQTADVTTY